MAQGRRVRRVLRKIDTWSLAKLAFLLHACFAVVFVVAGTILWFGADGAGAITKLEEAVKANLRLDTFSIDGTVLFRSAVMGSVLFAFIGTLLWVLGAFLFNMLSDLTGGVQVWVLEEVIFDQAEVETDVPIKESAEPAGLRPAADEDQDEADDTPETPTADNPAEDRVAVG
jgi:hypothetical protein